MTCLNKNCAVFASIDRRGCDIVELVGKGAEASQGAKGIYRVFIN
jgi:hypothetical protein